MNFKKVFRTMLFFILISVFYSNKSYALTELPAIYAEGIYLMDPKTNTVLYEKNSNTPYAPASTTKIMTAIIALENCNLSDIVTVGNNPPAVDGTAIGLVENNKYTLETLLHGLLLQSGNDCAEAIAEYISGSNEEFAKLMNQKAKELGANNTTFKNPSGLPQEGHVTTAHDLALIMKYAYTNEKFVNIARTMTYDFKNIDGNLSIQVSNKNHLLKEDSEYRYDYAYVGKTGYTIAANHCYIATAIKDEQVIIGAFLNASDKNNFYLSIGKLFDWGFENYNTEKIIAKGDKITSIRYGLNKKVKLVSNEDIYYTIRSDENINDVISNVKIEKIKEKCTKNEIKANEILFTKKVFVDNKEYTDIDLISNIDTKKVNLLNIGLNIIFIIIVIVFFIIFILKINKQRRKKLFKKRSRIIKK